MGTALPLSVAVKKPSQRVFSPPDKVQAKPLGFCSPQAFFCAKKSSQRLMARWILRSSALTSLAAMSNHSYRTRSSCKAVRTHSALAGSMAKKVLRQALRSAELSSTTTNWVRPWVGQALTATSLTRLNLPRQVTETDSTSWGVMSMRASK